MLSVTLWLLHNKEQPLKNPWDTPIVPWRKNEAKAFEFAGVMASFTSAIFDGTKPVNASLRFVNTALCRKLFQPSSKPKIFGVRG